MIIVNPVTIDMSKVITSNAALSVNTAWSSSTSYSIGNRVYFNGRDYEALRASTNVTPTTVTSPPTWLNLGASNRFAMFDAVISTKTSATTLLDVTIRPGAVVNSLSLFEITGNSVIIDITDPIEGLVYTKTVNLVDSTDITSWYAYFFTPVELKTDVILTDLPSYGSADIRIRVQATTGTTASIGETVVGLQKNLGLTLYGTSISIQDYSRKERDQFGNIVIVQRQFTKLADYDVALETSRVASVQKALADIRTTPTIFIGNPNLPETVVYGFYKQFDIVISGPSKSDCSIQVEGLV